MKKTYVKYFSALLLFGFNGIIASQIDLSSYQIVFLRTLIGSLFLMIVFGLSGQRFTVAAHRQDAICIAVSGLSMGASWLFLYEAYSLLGVSLASLLYYTGPIIVVALSPIVFKEKLSLKRTFFLAVVLLGVALINKTLGQSREIKLGFIYGAMSAVMYAVMVTANKMSKRVKGIENSLIQLMAGFATVFLFVVFKGGLDVHLGIKGWIFVLVMGLLNTGYGCYLYFSSIGELPAQTVAICGYIEPLSAMLLSTVVLHEVLQLTQIVGAALIIGGAAMGEIVNQNKSNYSFSN